MQYEFLLNSPLWAYRKSVAFLLLLTLLSWSLGLPSFINRANAASLTFVSDTLSDSGISAASNHTIAFTSPTGVSNGQTITVTFPASFNLTATTLNEIDVATSTGDFTLAANCTGAEPASAAISGQVLTVTFCPGDGGLIPANATTTIEIGTNATFQAVGAAANRIVNPTAGSYVISIGGTQADSADTRVMILSKVTVTAVVSTAFTFTISGVNAGVSVNATTTTATSTATTMPFATTTVGVPNSIAQQLSVVTNARNGFVVTVNADQNLLSATGADIDRFQNDVAVSTPVTWTAPTGTLGSENTYGHEGVSSDDTDLNSGEFTTGGPKYAGNFVGNARQVFSHNGPSDGTTPDKGLAKVLYTIQISALQEAGNDYTQTLTYVATPTF